MNTAISVIEADDAARNLEITHKLYAHDLEDIFNVTSASLDYFETSEGRKILDEYVQNRFQIKDENGLVQCHFIGTQIDFDVVYVFYSAPITTNKIVLKSEFLFEANKEQRNFVNIHFKGKVESFAFGSSDAAKSFSFVKDAW